MCFSEKNIYGRICQISDGTEDKSMCIMDDSIRNSGLWLLCALIPKFPKISLCKQHLGTLKSQKVNLAVGELQRSSLCRLPDTLHLQAKQAEYNERSEG